MSDCDWTILEGIGSRRWTDLTFPAGSRLTSLDWWRTSRVCFSVLLQQRMMIMMMHALLLTHFREQESGVKNNLFTRLRTLTPVGSWASSGIVENSDNQLCGGFCGCMSRKLTMWVVFIIQRGNIKTDNNHTLTCFPILDRFCFAVLRKSTHNFVNSWPRLGTTLPPSSPT